MRSRLTALQYRLELLLIGPLRPDVRRKMYVDVRGAIAVSAYFAIFSFVPIILRRMGASVQELAFYYAISALGLLTTSVGMWLMRRHGMRRVALLSWLAGRGALLPPAWWRPAPTWLG